MKSVKLNEFLSTINNLETLNCYYWNDNTIGSQYIINYDKLKEDILTEIFLNLSSLQQHQTNLYFYLLFDTIENAITNKSPTFSKEAKNEYERHLLECWKDEDFELFLCGDFNSIFDGIVEERIISRLDLINSLKSKIKEIESIYFDTSNNEVKTDIDTSDKTTLQKILTPNINLKQKIYLLDKIGFFDLEKVKDLKNETEKGKLVSLLLYTSEKNTIDNIRNRYSFNEKNQKKSINQLNSILTELGLEKL
jgi:hypothetical protein